LDDKLDRALCSVVDNSVAGVPALLPAFGDEAGRN
jgi:hypothetical protein